MASEKELASACHTNESATCAGRGGAGGWLYRSVVGLNLRLRHQPCAVKSCSQPATRGAHLVGGAAGLHYTVPVCRAHSSPAIDLDRSSSSASECHELKPGTLALLARCNAQPQAGVKTGELAAASDSKSKSKRSGTRAMPSELTMESFMEAYL